MPTGIVSMRASLSPRIYRDFEISAEASLYKLAEAINVFYGFLFDHPFGFYEDLNDPYGSGQAYELFADMGEPVAEGAMSVKRTRVRQAFDADGTALLFLFDYGDEWRFKVERLGVQATDAPKEFLRLIRSVGKAPKQYASRR